MNFERCLQGVVPKQGSATVHVEPSWGQGRSLFGGIQTGLMIHFLQLCYPERAHEIRSIQVAFMDAVAPGELTLEHSPLRSGRTEYHEVRLMQGGRLRCRVLAMIGAPRESQVESINLQYPEVKEIDSLRDLPFMPPMTPAFVQHFQMRFGRGDVPFTGSDKIDTGIFIRFRELQEAGLPALVALADVAPSPVLSQLSRPAAASSAYWTLDIVEPGMLLDGSDWFLLENHIQQSHAGFVSQNGALWCVKTRKLLAVTQQTVTVFG